MDTHFVRLKYLLRQRHWQTYRTFCAEYDKAASAFEKELVGTWPSRAQFHRWLTGELKGLPYPDHCRVLEEMFPDWSAAQLFNVPSPDEIRQLSKHPDATPDRPTAQTVDIAHELEVFLDLNEEDN